MGSLKKGKFPSVEVSKKKKGSLGTKLPHVEVSKKGESGTAHPSTPVEGGSFTTKLPHATKKKNLENFLNNLSKYKIHFFI